MRPSDLTKRAVSTALRHPAGTAAIGAVALAALSGGVAYIRHRRAQAALPQNRVRRLASPSVAAASKVKRKAKLPRWF